MKYSFCITTLFKTLNIIYDSWKYIYETKKVSHINRGDTLSHNDTQ